MKRILIPDSSARYADSTFHEQASRACNLTSIQASSEVIKGVAMSGRTRMVRRDHGQSRPLLSLPWSGKFPVPLIPETPEIVVLRFAAICCAEATKQLTKWRRACKILARHGYGIQDREGVLHQEVCIYIRARDSAPSCTIAAFMRIDTLYLSDWDWSISQGCLNVWCNCPCS